MVLVQGWGYISDRISLYEWSLVALRILGVWYHWFWYALGITVWSWYRDCGTSRIIPHWFPYIKCARALGALSHVPRLNLHGHGPCRFSLGLFVDWSTSFTFLKGFLRSYWFRNVVRSSGTWLEGTWLKVYRQTSLSGIATKFVHEFSSGRGSGHGYFFLFSGSV